MHRVIGYRIYICKDEVGYFVQVNHDCRHVVFGVVGRTFSQAMENAWNGCVKRGIDPRKVSSLDQPKNLQTAA